MSDYQIISDATADLDDALYAGLPEITVIPMDVLIDQDNYVYGPGGTLEIDAFYRAQREGKFASTSQIPPDRFFDAFRSVLEKGKDVLYLGLTSGLSGTFENACFVRDRLNEEYPDRMILCIDPYCASAGMGLLLRTALQKQAEGLTLSELADWILSYRLKVCHYFTVDTLEHLKHGGRISSAAAAIGTMLHIKPLLTVDEKGALEVIGKPRGRKQAIQIKLKHMEDNWDAAFSPVVMVAHGDCPEEAALFAEQIKAHFPKADILTTTIGPVIGSHTGPGMLALLYWGTRRHG